jgi:probable rRNA maturation factor
VTSFEVSVVLSGDEAVRLMNRDYRGKDKATNVLSFAALDNDAFIHPGMAFHLGDIILALETLKMEAKQQDKRLEDHFQHLLVHGTLHLLGYDHMEKDEAESMESLEIHILDGLGVENPYKNLNFMPE